jgi:multiple sugar transport system substrate-binding protein
MRMKAVVLAGTCLAAICSGGARAADVTLNALFQSQAGYSDQEVRDMTAAFMKQHPNIKVNLEFVPYEALHDKTVLARGSSHGYDVVLSDSVWTPEYAAHHIVADVTSRITAQQKAGILPGAMDSARWHGHMYGLPWIVDAKFLFYNKDMFKRAGIDTPPQTWADVEKDAILIKQKGIVEFPLVSSWSQNEALTADYTALLAGFGGKWLDGHGKPEFQTGGGLDAAKFMYQTVQVDKVTNPHSLEFVEDDVKKVFSSGQAAMGLNWTYMWGANDPGPDTRIAGQVGVVPAPGPKPGVVGTVDGTQPLCILANSKHQPEAWEFVTYLTSQAVQNAHAANSLPMWRGSFQDPKVVAGRTDLLQTAEKSFAVMIGRPEVVGYQQFSTTLQQSLQQVASGKVPADQALEAAAETIH